MTDVNVNINIRETGASKAAKGIDHIGNRASRAQRSVDRLRGILAAVGTGAAVAGISRLVGSYANLDRRLSQFATSARTSGDLLNDIRRVANDTGSALAGTAEGYSRLRVATEDLGFSHKRVIDLTEQTNKLIQLSGAGAQEATAGMIQFSQALASGRLQGDEFRSLMENVPALMRTIAEGMGVPVGQLRVLSREGKLTTETIITALDKMADSVDERFATLTDTPVQAFNRLATEAIMAFGQFAQSSGILASVTNVLNLLANNMTTIVPLIISFASGLTAALGVLGAYAAAVGAATLATRIFSGAIAANPIGAIATVVGIATFAIVQFIQTSGGIGPAMQRAGDAVQGLWQSVTRGLEGMAIRWEHGWNGFTLYLADKTLEWVKLVEGAVNGMLGALSNIPGFDGGGISIDISSGFAQNIVGPIDQAFSESHVKLLDFQAETKRIAALTRQEKFIDPVTFDETKAQLDETTTKVNSFGNALGSAGGGGGARMQTELQRINAQLQQLGAPLQQAQQAYSTLQGLQKSGIITNDQYAASLERIKGAFIRAGGTMQQFQSQVASSSSSIAQSLAGVAQNAITGFADALVDLAFTGKANFKQLAQSIIKQLVRIAVQALIVKPLLGFLGFSGGGGFGGGGGLLGFAKGGAFAGGAQMFANGGAFTNSVVNTPTPFKFAKGGVPSLGVMGEAGPEAIMPLKRGRDGKLGVAATGGGGGGTAIGELNVGNNMTIQVEGGSSDEGGEAQAVRISEAVQGALRGMVADEIWKANQYGGMLRPRGN